MPKLDWMRHLSEQLDLLDEPLPGVPVVELAGTGRVLIERHGGVTQYSPQRICVKVRYGTVQVCGCNMELTRMSREQLIISGKIDSVHLLRRDGK